MMEIEMVYIERVFFTLLVLIILNAVSVWLYRFGNKKVLDVLVTYDSHKGYLTVNSPLMKSRRKRFADWKKIFVGAFIYMCAVGMIFGFIGDDFVGDATKGAIVMGIMGFIMTTVFGLLEALFMLIDAKNPLLKDVIPTSKLTLITMSKQLYTPQVYDQRIMDESFVKKLIEVNPIIDELCRLNELREGIDGKADTEARKETLAELEKLIDLKNEELMPYVDYVFASVGAGNPLDEAESDFNKVDKEIALVKSKAQLS